MTFRVGQKVVCVDDRSGEFFVAWLNDSLVRGRIYEVCRIRERVGDYATVLELTGVNEGKSCNGWLASRFRPVVERKTDISVFTMMLKPSKVKA